MMAAHLVRRAPNRAPQQPGNALPQHGIGRRPRRVFVAPGLQQLADPGIGEGRVGAELPPLGPPPKPGDHRRQNLVPIGRAVHVAGSATVRDFLSDASISTQAGSRLSAVAEVDPLISAGDDVASGAMARPDCEHWSLSHCCDGDHSHTRSQCGPIPCRRTTFSLAPQTQSCQQDIFFVMTKEDRC